MRQAACTTITEHGVREKNEMLKVKGAHLKTRLVKRKQLGRGFTYAALTKIAFSSIQRRNDVARAFGCSGPWVGLVRKALPHAYRVEQQHAIAITRPLGVPHFPGYTNLLR